MCNYWFNRKLLEQLFLFFLPDAVTKNHPYFVKIIPLKKDNCALALRKRRFCVAKEPLLPCKTYAFGMQNNTFYNTLMYRQLPNNYAFKKYLHYCSLFLAYIIRNTSKIEQRRNGAFCLKKVKLYGCSHNYRLLQLL